MLYDRIILQGTINEPEGKPEPQFALQSTVNWMGALKLFVESKNLNFRSAKAFYATQSKRNMTPFVENTVLEQLFLGLHHLSALEKLKSLSPVADFARLGIIGWYYGVSNAASAMIAAQDGSFQEDHAGTARIFDNGLASRGLIMEPFNWRVSNLLKSNFDPEVAAYRANSQHNLLSKSNSISEANGALAAYLSGSAKWYAWKVTEDARNSKEFKELNVADFRTKKARELRDDRLIKRSMGFLHQAIRYRGKANYREALFLGYGNATETILTDFTNDQAVVLRAFLCMAGAFASQKLGQDLWQDFVSDVDAKSAFTTKATQIWKQ